MGLVTWTAVFTLDGLRDTPEEVAASINGLIGARLQRDMRTRLQPRGWSFAPATPVDHGWHAEAIVADEGKRLTVSLVTCPELDENTPDGRALDDRWRIVIGLDIGIFPKTRARRTALLTVLARDVDAAGRELGVRGVIWETGGP